MTKRIANYRKPALAPTPRHMRLNMRQVHKYNVSYDLELEAQVRSGDYFVTLATRLDMLVKSVPEDVEREHIDRIVSDLIYLQDNYRITRPTSA